MDPGYGALYFDPFEPSLVGVNPLVGSGTTSFHVSHWNHDWLDQGPPPVTACCTDSSLGSTDRSQTYSYSTPGTGYATQCAASGRASYDVAVGTFAARAAASTEADGVSFQSTSPTTNRTHDQSGVGTSQLQDWIWVPGPAGSTAHVAVAMHLDATVDSPSSPNSVPNAFWGDLANLSGPPSAGHRVPFINSDWLTFRPYGFYRGDVSLDLSVDHDFHDEEFCDGSFCQTELVWSTETSDISYSKGFDMNYAGPTGELTITPHESGVLGDTLTLELDVVREQWILLTAVLQASTNCSGPYECSIRAEALPTCGITSVTATAGNGDPIALQSENGVAGFPVPEPEPLVLGITSLAAICVAARRRTDAPAELHGLPLPNGRPCPTRGRRSRRRR